MDSEKTPYQVLARKWRPQRFSQVVGQAAIVRTLSNALEQGRIAHAYCFSGIRGVGKTTVARLLAKGLNCQTAPAPTSDPCCECDACVEIEESRNLDVVEMDAASQTGVDDIRQLNEFARYTPSRDRYRVFIVDEAHMLSNQAFNALLKTLEEPPPHVVFMLATTEPHKILQTVLSRCQHYHLGRISQGEIRARLREISESEGVRVSDDALALVASAADGSMRDAQSLLDKLIAFAGTGIDDEIVVDLLGMVDRELLFQMVDRVTAEDLGGVLALVDEMVEQGVDLHQFTLDLLGHLRGLLVARSVEAAGGILHLPDADIVRLREQAGRFELDDLDRAFALLSASEYRIKQSEVPRYHLEMALGRLARMPRLTPIADLVSALRAAPSPGGGPSSAAGGGSTPGGGRSRPAAAKSRSRGSGARSETTGPIPDAAQAGADSEGPPPRTYGFDDRPRRAPDPEPEADAPEEGNGPAVDAKVGLVLQRLRDTKPMIAQVLARAETIELKEDVLLISFPSNRSLFKDRLKDRSSLQTIEEAAKTALGRGVRVMTGIAAAEPPPPSPPKPSQPAEPSGAEEAARKQLWQRAEQEPLVSRFIEALGGQLTEVEEIREK